MTRASRWCTARVGPTRAATSVAVAAALGCGRIGFGELGTRDAAMVDGAPACMGHEQPANVLVPAPVPFCIDVTEVSNAHYARFLATGPSTGEQPPHCSWNTTFVPTGWPPPAGEDDLPASRMDWCDARAYCEWAGKRLCGRIGGGAVPPALRSDWQTSEWLFACTEAGARMYSYGPSYVDGACVDASYTGPRPAPIGSATACEGGYAGIFDLSGNIAEWDDSCDVTSGASDMCYYRGGEYRHAPFGTSCDILEGYTRDNPNEETGGLRCCADPA